jgi:rubredoxin
MDFEQINFGPTENQVRSIFAKNKVSFFCPLCRTPRQLKYRSDLSKFNYLQILVVSAMMIYFLFDFIGVKSLLVVFFNWIFFEATNKFLFRKNIPCPDCGFDATWYKKDVKMAKRKVAEFWARNKNQ